MPDWPQTLEHRRAELKRTELNDSRKARLYKSTLVLDDAQELSAIVAEECDFDGYTPQDVSCPDAAVIAPGVNAYFDSSTLEFPVGGSGGGQEIGGVFITDDASPDPTELIEIYPLAAPITTVNDVPVKLQLRDGIRNQVRCV